MPKVSVITVNYNNAAGLEDTLKSVISQTYPDLEYLVIDGGSGDGSAAIIEKYQDHISYWVSEKDTGVYHAMNKGISKASGDYLLFLNSGDFLVDPQVIGNLMDGETGEIDLVYGDLQRTFPDGSQDTVKMREFIDAETILEETLCHPVTLIHRRLFANFGPYDERLRIVADWAFFLKVILLGNATQKHKQVLVANFSMDGMSSLPANQHEILQEREWVKNHYLSPAFARFYQDYIVYKSFYHNKWLSRGRRLKALLRGKK